MISKLKKFIKKSIIEPTSIATVLTIINSDTALKEIWEQSFVQFPDFSEHFTFIVDNKEVEHRIRLLVVAETAFMKKAISDVLQTMERCSYADIGDSDGSVQLLLQKYFPSNRLKSVGINLQKGAIRKIEERGLNAIYADAQSLKDQKITYDVVSVFETLEHLPDPIGFLKGLTSIVNKSLIISVPFIRHSRTGLYYLTNRWEKDRKATIESTHIFELSPKDWRKIFLHSGWKVDHEQTLLMFHPRRLSRLILQPYWKYESFEGFWFASLSPCDQYSSQYSIE